MIAFDSNILIYILENEPIFGPKSEDIFHQIENIGGVCSALAITETMYKSVDTFEKITPLLSPSVKVVAISVNIAIFAGNIKTTYGLKNADAIHIATAIASKADVFITNDQKLLKKKIPGIKIRGL